MPPKKPTGAEKAGGRKEKALAKKLEKGMVLFSM
jgi:hypothetical protein